MIKGSWKDYFTFTKKERNAVFILLLILLLLIVAPYLVPAKKMTISIDEKLQEQLDKYLQQHPRENRYEYEITSITDSVPQTGITAHELFAFDPNTLNKEGFKKLGLSDKVANTIINYRTKGGYFKIPDDIRKIYGLSTADADRLIKYIKIASSRSTDERQQIKQPASNKQTAYKPINVNTATAEEWKTLPGIGEVLGNRIVKFRTKLGSFKSLDDIRKTYGLSDSTFQVIRPYLILQDSAQ